MTITLSKKKLAIGTAVLILLLSLGLTYAWFNSVARTETNIQMGDLKISASFTDINVMTYEPGNSPSSKGTIINVGDMDAVIKVKGTAEISYKYSDGNYTPWNGPEWVPDNDNAVKTTLSGDVYGYGEDSDGTLLWIWFYNIKNADDKYLVLTPGSQVNLSIKSILDGNVMTNIYKDSKIKIANDIRATETYDGALMQEFGVVNDDFDIYFGDADGFSGRNAHQVPDYIMEQVNAIFHR